MLEFLARISAPLVEMTVWLLDRRHWGFGNGLIDHHTVSLPRGYSILALSLVWKPLNTLGEIRGMLIV